MSELIRQYIVAAINEKFSSGFGEKARKVVLDASIKNNFDGVSKVSFIRAIELAAQRAEKAEAKVKEWQTVAEMLADELNECNSERRPISWEDASESSPAWIAYTNLRDRDDDE